MKLFVDDRLVVERAWAWIPMPEKKYFGYVEIKRSKTGARRCDIQMVDPIPNKLCDECYGFSSPAKSVDEAVEKFAEGMLDDRERYVLDRSWRPSRNVLKTHWKRRRRRLKEIHDYIKDGSSG